MLEEVESSSAGKTVKKQAKEEDKINDKESRIQNLQANTDSEDLGIIDLDK